jgi:hypothetical protein
VFKLYKVIVHIVKPGWGEQVDIHYARAACPEQAILEVVRSLIWWSEDWAELEVSLA